MTATENILVSSRNSSREIRAAYGPQFAASFEKLIDATPDGRKRVTAREQMKAFRAQLAAKQVKAAQG